ncbi:molybdate ABC transporter permease subunit [bacterium]|nr:molybdate ABC transporter permease subunit [bacterium]
MNWFPFYLSLKVAVVATLLNSLLGTGIAWTMARRQFRGKALIEALLVQPLVMPPTVLGYYLLTSFGRYTPLGDFLAGTLGISLVFTWQGAVLASSVSSIPLFIMPARAAFEGIDRRLEQVARTLGQGRWGVFRTISLPLAWRGIVAGMVMTFARAMGEFGATLMLAGNIPGKTQTASIAIYDAVQSGDTTLANTLVALMTLLSIAALWFANRFLKR